MDINRYNRHDWTVHELYENFPDDYPENPVPEAVAIHDVIGEVDPAWSIDFHRQGSYMVDYESTFDVEEVIDADDDDEMDDDDDDTDESSTYPPSPAAQ